MNKLYFYKGNYGILDNAKGRIFWVYEDLSPIWSQYVYGQKSIDISSLDSSLLELICELEFNYEHVTENGDTQSLD